MDYKSVIIGTAGHIDHGKSSIVKALTGIDPDRLKEEKKRGITTDLGFAYLKDKNLILSFIDVPGHEALIKNMIAGATNFNICLLAVDAKEGIKEQTVEHTNIISFLKIETVIGIITKKDLVDESTIQSRIKELEDFLKSYNFKHTYTLAISKSHKNDISQLKAILLNLAAKYKDDKEKFPFLLNIDRVFSLKGQGTVITGTTLFGKISQGEEVTVFPLEKKTKIKSIHNHNIQIKEALPNMRTAINLANISKTELKRGNILHKDSYYSTTTFLAKVSLFEKIKKNFEIKHNKQYLTFAGTDYFISKIILLGKKSISPGESEFAIVKTDKPIITYPTQKMLIRSGSPQITIGGIKTLFLEKNDLKKENLIKLADSIDKNEKKEVIKILTQKNGFFTFKNSHQFLFLTEQELKDLLHPDFEVMKNCIYKKELINQIANKILSLLKNSDQIIFESLEEFKKLPNLLKPLILSEIKRSAPKNTTITEYEIKKTIKNPFETLAWQILDEMKKDLSITNAQNISEKANIDKKVAEKILDFLSNRDLVKKIDETVYLPSEIINLLEKKALLIAKKYGYIDIKNIKTVIKAPRKTIIAFLEYLDKTGRFIKKDNKRYLK